MCQVTLVECTYITMNAFSSSLLEGRLWFGKYPTPEEVQCLEQSGMTHMVNLCTPDNVTWTPYTTSLPVMTYPFYDGKLQYPLGESRDMTTWTTFDPFLTQLVTLLANPNTRLYVHCKGGHGRSAMVAALLVARHLDMDADTALSLVHAAHQERTEMKPRWRRLGAPQRARQKAIVHYYASSSWNKSVS